MPRSTTLRRAWNDRTSSWHSHVQTTPAFDRVREELLAEAGAWRDAVAVDLGAGTGFVTIPLAAAAGEVIAVDLAEAMLDRLEHDARLSGVTNVRTVCADLATVDLAEGSVDIVVSSYALHHLVDADKRALLVRCHRWLRPGGKIVIADMMFGRGGTAQDRRIIRAKVAALLRKGPKGAWRVVKNLVRFGVRRGTELPASPTFWVDALSRAGFGAVEYRPIVQEAGLVYGRVAPEDPRAGANDDPVQPVDR